jgi:hypothetical protein
MEPFCHYVAVPLWLRWHALPLLRAQRNLLPVCRSHHHSEKVHKGVYLHARGTAYRWKSRSGRLHTDCHHGGI